MGLSVHDPFIDPLGNPLGLAKVLGLLSINPTIVDFINGAAGDFIIPAGFSFFRVTAVGGGEGGTSARSGGGGGLARTAILPCTPGLTIKYAAGVGGGFSAGATPSTVSFKNYNMVGGPASGITGGMGSGGDANFKGGDGKTISRAGGGGAAGPTSDGGNADSSPYTGDGGGPGISGSTGFGGSGGGGVGAPGGGMLSASPSAASVLPGVGNSIWGSPGAFSPGSAAGDGGAWGGGAGRRENSGNTGNGGYGGVRIELW